MTDMRFTRAKPGYACWLLLYPLFWLATRLKIRGRRTRSRAHHEGERELFRWMMNLAMLVSDQLLVITQKQAQQGNAAELAAKDDAFDRRSAA